MTDELVDMAGLRTSSGDRTRAALDAAAALREDVFEFGLPTTALKWDDVRLARLRCNAAPPVGPSSSETEVSDAEA